MLQPDPRVLPYARLSYYKYCNIVDTGGTSMTGDGLRRAREAQGWTQQEAARRLGVTQGYVSLVEGNRRKVPPALAGRLQRLLTLPPTALPLVEAPPQALTDSELARLLAALGYPGFAYRYRTARASQNPAQVLLRALGQSQLDARLVEALPWLLLRYSELDWRWLLKQAKLRDLQNRLGFVVAVARKVAERLSQPKVAARLSRYEREVDRSRLVREDTLCHESMTQAERRWLRERRPPEAAHWNLLCDLKPDDLSYGA